MNAAINILKKAVGHGETSLGSSEAAGINSLRSSHDILNRSSGVAIIAIALEEIADGPPVEMGPQLLGEIFQEGDVASGLTLGMSEMDLGRIVIKVKVVDPNMDEFIHPRARKEDRRL